MFVLATGSCRTFGNTSCLPVDKPHTSDLFYQLLMHNFERHSSSSIGHRSPWIIELDFAWLSSANSARLDALIRFIQFILRSPSHRHVYFVSIEKALEWMKYPRALPDLRHFWAFRCSGKSRQYTTDCAFDTSDENNQDSISNVQSLLADNQTNSSDAQAIDRQGEKLFQSGIALHSLWIFILLISCVLFYDKYFTSK
jgi:hypothetical protein